MRTFYLITLFSCAASWIVAQNITIDPGSAYVSGDPSVIAEAHATLHNNGSQDQSMTWLRKVNDIPDGWESSICDPNLCWAPFANAPSYGFSLTSGGTGSSYVKFDARNMPDGPAIPGIGYVEVVFYSLTDSANYNASGTYTADLSGVGFFSPNAANSFSVYPNPAINDVNLVASYSSSVDKIKIVNIVGKVVYTADWQVTQGKMIINVAQLTEGIYFVQFVSTDNTIIATKKLAVKD
jgi:hypothetical protein